MNGINTLVFNPICYVNEINLLKHFLTFYIYYEITSIQFLYSKYIFFIYIKKTVLYKIIFLNILYIKIKNDNDILQYNILG
jgi:hypothetical protein